MPIRCAVRMMRQAISPRLAIRIFLNTSHDCPEFIVMAGLVPAIHGVVTDFPQCRAMKEAWVYIMTNRPNGTSYTGVTSDLAKRVWEHREGVVEGFTKRHRLK